MFGTSRLVEQIARYGSRLCLSLVLGGGATANATERVCACEFEEPPADRVALGAGGFVRIAGLGERCQPEVVGVDVEPTSDPFDSVVDVDFLAASDWRRIPRYHLGDVWSIRVPETLDVDVSLPLYIELSCYTGRYLGWFDAVVAARAVNAWGPFVELVDLGWDRVDSSADRMVTSSWIVNDVGTSGYLVHAWDRVQSDPTLDLWQPLFNADGSQEVVANARWDGPVPRELCLDWELLDPFDQVALTGSEPCRTLRTGCDHTGGPPWTWAVLPALVGLRRRRHASGPGDLTVAIEHGRRRSSHAAPTDADRRAGEAAGELRPGDRADGDRRADRVRRGWAGSGWTTGRGGTTRARPSHPPFARFRSHRPHPDPAVPRLRVRWHLRRP